MLARGRTYAIPIFAILLLRTPTALADWPRDGALVSNLAAAYGTQVRAVSDGAGGALVGWIDSRHFWDTSQDIFLQRIRSDGTKDPAWPSGGSVVCDAPLDQVNPTMCSDLQGGAFIAWMDARGDQDSTGNVNWPVYLQRIQSDGRVSPGWPLNGLQISPYSNVYPGSLLLISDGAGGVYATWEERSVDRSSEVYVQHVSQEGTLIAEWPERGATVTSRAGSRYSHGVVSDGVGGIYVCWTEEGSASPGIYVTRLNSSGATDVGWLPGGDAVFLGTGGYSSLVVTGEEGGVIVAWSQSGVQGVDIRARRLESNAARDPHWSDEGALVCSASGWRQAPVGVSDGAGGAIIAWPDWRGHSDPNDGPDVYAQHILFEGVIAKGWSSSALRVSPISGLEWFPTITTDGAGGAYIAWTDYPDGLNATSNAVAQHVLASGELAPGWTIAGIRATLSESRQEYPALVAGSGRDLFVAVSGYGSGISPRVVAQHMTYYGIQDDVFEPHVTILASDRVRLEWNAPAEFDGAVTILRRAEGSGWIEVSRGVTAAGGTIAWDDETVVPGFGYEYRLEVPEGNGLGFYGLVTLRLPLALYVRMASANPSRGDPVIEYAVSNAMPARLELYDVRGRIVESRNVSELGPGPHRTTFSGLGIPAGVYFLRLAQGTSEATRRLIIVR
jgi:hypothetical protein